MTEKLSSLVVSLAMIVILTACGSTLGQDDSGAGENGTDTGVSTPEGSPMRALWKVSSYIIGRNSSMNEAAAQALVFKPLDITDTEIIFDGQSCQGVIFQQKTVNAVDYLAGTWQTTPTELGIDFTELQVIKTNCSLPGFQEYMRLGDRRLVVPIKGVFFFFAPTAVY
jgi:hypothetical protein